MQWYCPFSLFIPWLMLGVSNSNVTMKFVQLHFLYHKIFGGIKDIVSSPLSKSLGGHVPPSPLKTRSLLYVRANRSATRFAPALQFFDKIFSRKGNIKNSHQHLTTLVLRHPFSCHGSVSYKLRECFSDLATTQRFIQNFLTSVPWRTLAVLHNTDLQHSLCRRVQSTVCTNFHWQ